MERGLAFPSARRAMGAPTLAEAGTVLESRLGAVGWTWLNRFLQEFAVTIVPFTEHHAMLAVDAYSRFGKGRHPAALNFGDCLVYAVAQSASEPLLCLGNDFARTDLQLVVQR